MPPTHRRLFALAIALPLLTSTASARALWMLEEFKPEDGRTLLPRQAGATCSSDAKLNQCPSDFPPNFCCGQGTTCLHINTNNSSVTAAICCPDGQSCEVIQPFNCNVAAQDANQSPQSQLHSIPPQELATCGSGCCPMGYSCENGQQCVAQVSLTTGSGSSPSTTKSPTTLPDSNSGSSSPTPTKGAPVQSSPSNSSSGPTFSGKSFAAGFIPGIAIGVIIAALLIFCCTRKMKDRYPKRSKSPDAEKSRDTLTDLGPQIGRPMMHGRSISEPTVDPTAMGVTRTDFLRSSPTRTIGSNDIIANNYDTGTDIPRTPPTGRTPKIKALFSRSPFLNNATPSTPPQTQPPMPAHLKRGTLSFQVSPIRALKKQKSMHSLRRQMSENRTDSTETIQVLMSPDEEPSYKAAPGPWSTTIAPSIARTPPQRVPYASSSRYPSELNPPPGNFRIPSPPPPVPRHQTGVSGGPSFLDSPYTPTKTASKSGGGLAVPGEGADARRDTTFSSLMQKAGLRKSELVMGSKKRIDAKYGY